MHPTLFTIGGWPIPSYGALSALGIVAAFAVAWHLGRRRGLGSDLILDVIFWGVVAGFAGARLGYLLLTWRESVRAPLESIFGGGGGIYLTGMVAGAGACAWLARRRTVPVLVMADVLAPALALGHAFGRVGCYLAGCCWGCRITPGRFPGTVTYPRITGQDGRLEGSWPWMDHVRHGWISSESPVSAPVVPVQLLEAGFNFALFGILLWFGSAGRRPGKVALLYLLGYSGARFLFEFLRGDVDRGHAGPFSLSQWICLAVAFLLVLVLVAPWGLFSRFKASNP